MKLSNIQYLYKSIQIKAIEAVLDPDDTYSYRRICRWYSKTFHTPLQDVYKLDFEHVLSNYYESTFEEIPYNDLYDIAIEDFIPELAEQNNEDAEQYAKDLEAEQIRTLERKARREGKTAQPVVSAPVMTKNQRDSKNVNKADKKQSLESKANNDQSPQPEEINIAFDDENLEEP
jgi:primosomal protein N'